MRAHEAGALHSDGYGAAPQWLPHPTDVNVLLPQLWSSGVDKDTDGVLTVAGMRITDLVAEHGTPAYVVDEADFRARARSFRDDFGASFAGCGGLKVYYAGKAFLCTQVARWVMEEGLGLDVCSGGELAVAQRVGFPGERLEMHGNNKSVAEIEAGLRYGIGRIVMDSFDEIERVTAVAARLGVVAPVMLRVTAGVEAHTHEFIATAHEDQKFGFSIAGGQAMKAAEAVLAHPELNLLGLHSHIGSQIFDTSGFEVAARRVLSLHAQIARESGHVMPELDLGGGFGIAYTSENTPLSAAELGSQLARIIVRECAVEGIDVPAVSIEPGRAIAGPSAFTVYEVGTVKEVHLDHGARRAYVSVDGGMSDNARTALYGADYSVTLANRRSDAPPMISRVVGKHCESGDIVVMDEYLPQDVRPGDLLAVPGTGAYCRALSSQYNHVPRPPVVAVRRGAEGVAEARVIVRRETVEDILGLDVDA
ncbi:diaminopimelate decarboxylase [Austwickia chelonae]|uniref:Diaminopimelate decarboxylase n=1 Tax=Austwickia chelonae NBRC 105200 TaxID=1184607 RepID=K6V3Q6_9MICO|nr:diaminopimelate decarboxylase [Austwickia chelonae]GAB76733.1 diaminopimelate decarboxylase [Austwickia chelonae NBRC 105200]SEW29906.1 diaminopimelate decarboxylase [Austwickia chelonae]